MQLLYVENYQDISSQLQLRPIIYFVNLEIYVSRVFLLIYLINLEKKNLEIFGGHLANFFCEVNLKIHGRNHFACIFFLWNAFGISFIELVGKVLEHAVIRSSITKYYKTLKMQCTTKVNMITYLRVLSNPALDAL